MLFEDIQGFFLICIPKIDIIEKKRKTVIFMVLLQCYTASHIENISICLRLKPQKLVMAGEKRIVEDTLTGYREVLSKRLPHTEVEPLDVTGKDFGELCDLFRSFFAPEETYVVDLSGGEAPVVMAMGAALAALSPGKRSTVSVLKFDEKLEKLLDCIHDYREIPGNRVLLSVEEVIRLHGGSVYPSSYQPPEKFTAFQLQPVWELATDPDLQWNKVLSWLIEFQSYNQAREDFYIPFDKISGLKDFAEKEAAVSDLLKKMDKKGIVVDRSNYYALKYSYTDPVYRYCMEKAGNILELKVLLEARALKVDGKLYFNDCLTSVNIDWDGEIKNKGTYMAIPETRNEIDVVLMHGVTPLFISCKNGDIKEGEIYKLHTVARQFGGPQARMALIAAKPDAVSAALEQRGWDMDVQLVSNAASMKKKDWEDLFTGVETEALCKKK